MNTTQLYNRCHLIAHQLCGNTGTYISLMSGINAVASDARALDEDDTNQGRYYMALKDCEYDYLEQLTLYVPILLSNEDFFSSVFQ